MITGECTVYFGDSEVESSGAPDISATTGWVDMTSGRLLAPACLSVTIDCEWVAIRRWDPMRVSRILAGLGWQDRN